jgi:membrane protein
MKHYELSLYPKLSPIYNKIIQLISAILLLLVVLYLWVLANERHQQTLNQHFHFISEQYLSQVAQGVYVFHDNKDNLTTFIDQIANKDWIKDISYYDKTGQIIYQSDQQDSINDLFGLSSVKTNRSIQYVPFIQELRENELEGYIRLTVERNLLIKELNVAGNNQYHSLGIMLLMAGVIGFLLTRGFNRFSRQGYRVQNK